MNDVHSHWINGLISENNDLKSKLIKRWEFWICLVKNRSLFRLPHQVERENLEVVQERQSASLNEAMAWRADQSWFFAFGWSFRYGGFLKGYPGTSSILMGFSMTIDSGIPPLIETPICLVVARTDFRSLQLNLKFLQWHRTGGPGGSLGSKGSVWGEAKSARWDVARASREWLGWFATTATDRPCLDEISKE